MCAFGEFWWIFLAAVALSFFIIIMVPSGAHKAGMAFGIICVVSIALLAVAGSAKSDLRCKEMRYQSVLDKRPSLAQECPDREKPSCLLKWIRYQQDSLNRYLRVLQ